MLVLDGSGIHLHVEENGSDACEVVVMRPVFEFVVCV
jgi:hypothetical protein